MTVVNITVSNDADFYRVFQYQTVAGLPISIVGASMQMMLRRHASDAEALLRLGTDTGEIVIVDGASGLFSIRITQEVLERLGLGDYDQSNVMTFEGTKRSIWTGTFTNNPGPSR